MNAASNFSLCIKGVRSEDFCILHISPGAVRINKGKDIRLQTEFAGLMKVELVTFSGNILLQGVKHCYLLFSGSAHS